MFLISKEFSKSWKNIRKINWISNEISGSWTDKIDDDPLICRGGVHLHTKKKFYLYFTHKSINEHNFESWDVDEGKQYENVMEQKPSHSQLLEIIFYCDCLWCFMYTEQQRRQQNFWCFFNVLSLKLSGKRRRPQALISASRNKNFKLTDKSLRQTQN